MTAPAHAGARLRHVDALRGLAALAVLYQHLLEHIGRLAPDGAAVRAHMDWTLDWLDFGKAGVFAFFAISGYIVPFSFRGAAPRLGFVLSRFFRLYPAYWVSLALAALLLPALGAADHSPRQLLANLTMLQTFLGEKDVVGVYWTLAVEWLFYALCLGLACAGWLRSPRALTSLFCAMLAIALAGAALRGAGPGSGLSSVPINVPIALPLYLAVMLFGTCLRLAETDPASGAARHAVPMLALLAAVVPLAWSTGYGASAHRESAAADITAFYLALAAFVLVVKLRWPAARTLAYAGAISYSVYLFHPLALDIAGYLAAPLAWPLSGVVLAAVAPPLTLAASHLVHHAVERPAIRLGGRLAAALSERLIPIVSNPHAKERA